MSTDMADLDAIPYFLWNERTTVRRLREILSDESSPLRATYAARVMREGRVRDLWAFMTPREAAELWPQVERHLGRRRDFWRFLFDTWRAQGAL